VASILPGEERPARLHRPLVQTSTISEKDTRVFRLKSPQGLREERGAPGVARMPAGSRR